jgi:RISC-loading complex subunit TARBP2
MFVKRENFSSSSSNIQELQRSYNKEKAVNNPIGSLQELCMSYHWPPPKYSMQDEEGLPHERQYTIMCSILNHRQFGQGKSKKLAKRQAAHKMWQYLQEQIIDEDEVRYLILKNLIKFLTDENFIKQFIVKGILL